MQTHSTFLLIGSQTLHVKVLRLVVLQLLPNRGPNTIFSAAFIRPTMAEGQSGMSVCSPHESLKLLIGVSGRPRVFFDIEIGGRKEGRIVFELVCAALLCVIHGLFVDIL